MITNYLAEPWLSFVFRLRIQLQIKPKNVINLTTSTLLRSLLTKEVPCSRAGLLGSGYITWLEYLIIVTFLQTFAMPSRPTPPPLTAKISLITCNLAQFGHLRFINKSKFGFIKHTFAARHSHSLLWQKATAFLKSHKGYLRPYDATVACAQTLKHLILITLS